MSLQPYPRCTRDPKNNAGLISPIGSRAAGVGLEALFNPGFDVKVELIDINSCKKNLVAEVPAAELDEEIHKLALQYGQRVKVPGFRPGKVPIQIIKQRFANELRSDATHDVIQRHWKSVVKEHDLHPLAEPVLEQVNSEPGNPVKFTVSFEVLPPLEIKNYTGLPYKFSEPHISDADVDKALEELREQNSQYIPVESEEIRDGHLVTLTVDGEFEGGGKPLHEDDVVCVVGDPHTNETFSENLRGAKLGETHVFDVSYAADYHRSRFAGKTLHYRALIKDIKEKQLPELNDDFAKDLYGHESLEQLRAKIRDDLVTKSQQLAEKKAREELLGRLVQSHSFDVPDCLVQDELQDHAQRLAANLARQGIDVNKASVDWRKIFEEERPRAAQAVSQMLVLDAIARQEKLDVSEAELEEEFQKLAEGTKKSAAAIRAQFEKDKRIHGFIDHLRQKKALDFIFRNANINRG